MMKKVDHGLTIERNFAIEFTHVPSGKFVLLMVIWKIIRMTIEQIGHLQLFTAAQIQL